MADPPVDAILQRVARRLGPIQGEPRPLAGGITNRNLRVHLGDRDYVVRLAGKDTALLGIDRGAEAAATEYAAEIGIGPPVALYLPEDEALVTRFIEGEPMDAEQIRDPDCLADVAQALRTVHVRGRRMRARFSAFRVVETYRDTVLERGGHVPEEDYAAAAGVAARIEEVMHGPEHDPVPCHNDLLPANLLHDGDRVRLVDWEYAGMGDRYFDLGNLSINAEFDEGDDEWLLTTYFGAPPTGRQFACLRLMRVMSDFREAMWAVVQGTISNLDFAFDAYAAEHFARLRREAQAPHFEGWLDEARA